MRKTAKTDTLFANKIISLTLNPARLHASTIIFLLQHDFGHLLDGKPLSVNSLNREDATRIKYFDHYCSEITDLVVNAKLLFYKNEMIGSDLSLCETSFLHITRSGKLYLRLPFEIQKFYLATFKCMFKLINAFKKYKFIFSLSTVLVNLITWLKSHSLSTTTVTISVLIGVITSLIVNFFKEKSENDSYNDNNDDNFI